MTDLQVKDPLVMGFSLFLPFVWFFLLRAKTKRKIEGKTKRNDSFLAEDDPGSDMVAVEWRFCWEKFDQVFV